MALVTVLTRNSALRDAVRAPLGPHHEVAGARSWDRLLWVVRERPVTVVVLDSGALGDGRGQAPEEAVAELTRRFPSLGTVFVHRPQIDPLTLFRLGRVGIDGLALVRLDGLDSALRAAMARASTYSTRAQVVRAIGHRLRTREVGVVRLALTGAQLGWGTDDLARQNGLSRAHLSVRLRSSGLPSAGHLLIWAKLLHAGRWLADAGRSAESVSRQLEYSSGAAFRRALHNYVGGTPTEVRDAGGLTPVLARFLDVCGLTDTVDSDRSVA